MPLPIDMDILQKRKEIPINLAKLSYIDKDQAVHFMRLWGEKRVTINEIHEQLTEAVKEELNNADNHSRADAAVN